MKSFLILLAATFLVSCASSPYPRLEEFHAASLGDVKALELVSNDDIDKPTRDGTTLLMVAARRARADAVKYLLQRGANPNARDAQNQTPLHYAVASLDPDTISALIMAGADASVTDAMGTTPIISLAVEHRFALVKMSLEHRKNWSRESAIRADLVEELESASANVRRKDADLDASLTLLKTK